MLQLALQHCRGDLLVYTTLALAPNHSEVAFLPPLLSPAVLHHPVWLASKPTIVDTIAHQQHSYSATSCNIS